MEVLEQQRPDTAPQTSAVAEPQGPSRINVAGLWAFVAVGMTAWTVLVYEATRAV